MKCMQTVAEVPFVAGHVALDFVNTAEERGHPEAGEALHGPADLWLWGERYGLLGSDAGGGGVAEFRRAIEARELLYGLFLAQAEGRSPGSDELQRLGELAAAAYREGALVEGDDGRVHWRWPASELSTVRHVAVTEAVALLAARPGSRLKQCPGDHCGWFFLDATKRGNRRWCSMGECGQDAKSARRRARRSDPE